jgi:hypothetical protein
VQRQPSQEDLPKPQRLHHTISAQISTRLLNVPLQYERNPMEQPALERAPGVHYPEHAVDV